MLILVARAANLEKLQQTVSNIPLSIIALIVLGYVTGQFISSYKWWTIVKAGGIKVSYPIALKAYFIGMFVNCFGLGMIGGDVARGVLVAHGLPKKAEGIASVVVDRIHGLTVLSLLALCTSLTIGRGIVKDEFVFALLVLCLGFISSWVFGPTLLKRIPYLRKSKLAGKLNNVAEMVPQKKRVLVLITIISVIFHSLQISMHALMAYGVGAYIPWSTLFVVIPFVNIASSLPISWNGLGVREKSYEFFLTPLLILSPEQALAFGGVWLLAVTVCSAVGGIVALVSGDLKLLKVNPKMVTSANDDLPSATKRVSGEHS